MVKEIFEKVKGNMLFNTSYPYNKSIWKKYLTKKPLFGHKYSWKVYPEISFYIHIPFCKNLCKFCEYTRFNNISEEDETYYVSLLEKQIKEFLHGNYNFQVLRGLDIGGGTPSLLSPKNLEHVLKLKNVLENNFTVDRLADNYVPSIEGSFATWTEDKIKLLSEYGIKRVSMGVQTVSKKILESNDREVNPLYKMEEVINLLRKYGIEKINLDFMYGLSSDIDGINSNIELISKLKPEHVTLYETRYNSNLLDQPETVNRTSVFNQYAVYFANLKAEGYDTRFGMNTFSNCYDKGLSSYLESRMFDFTPYKGFGISAQSCNFEGLSYNVGKNNTSFKDSIKDGKIEEEYIYKLPYDELAGKFVAISLYSGQFDMLTLAKIIKQEPYVYYKDELDFLLENKLLELSCDTMMRLTPKGFKEYGAVATLFAGKDSREYILNL